MVTQKRHASTAALNQRAASMRRIEADHNRQAGAMRELQGVARHRCLAQESNRRLLIDELECQLEPDRLGHVEVR